MKEYIKQQLRAGISFFAISFIFFSIVVFIMKLPKTASLLSTLILLSLTGCAVCVSQMIDRDITKWYNPGKGKQIYQNATLSLLNGVSYLIPLAIILTTHTFHSAGKPELLRNFVGGIVTLFSVFGIVILLSMCTDINKRALFLAIVQIIFMSLFCYGLFYLFK